MELRTSSSSTITHLPSNTNRHGYLAGNAVHRISLPLQRTVSSLCLQSRIGTLRCTGKFQGETSNEFGDGAVVAAAEEETSEAAEDEQTQAIEFLNDIKLDSGNTYSILLFGSGAIVALYLTCAIVGSIESIPLFPKLMEVVGLGYTLWFTTRYLLFKRNREELKLKISEIKKQVLGSDIGSD